MKTITTVLPVYDQLNKQLYYRVKADKKGLLAAVVTPRHRLPSMQWNVTENTGAINSVKLVVPVTLVETEIRTYFLKDRLLRPSTGVAPLSDLPTNGGYDTFTDYAGVPERFDAIKTTALGEVYVETCAFSINKGMSLVVRGSFTVNSGTAPEVVIVDSTGLDISNTLRIANGSSGYYILTATESDSAARVHFRNLTGELVNYSANPYYLNGTSLPGYHTYLTDDYFQYDGETLAIPLPEGRYYLKMTTSNGYIYYSEIFYVPCIYPNLTSTWTNVGYETLTLTGTSIVTATNTAGTAKAVSDSFTVKKDEIIYIAFYITLRSGDLPDLIISDTSYGNQSIYTIEEGLNFIAFTAPIAGDVVIYFYNDTNADYTTFEALIFRNYSDEYLRINFTNNCDLGDLVYQDGWDQSVWLKTEPMEMTFPQEEKGVENGEARFVRTFARQVKKYTVRTPDLPGYMAEVFHRMKLHDTVELTDLVGDTNDVYNLEVEHEWLWDDKYYCKADLTFDFNEVFVIGGCCNNLT